MAKKPKAATQRADATENDQPRTGPDPIPKVGDKVNYIMAHSEGDDLEGKTLTASVTVVHEGHEGRLLNVLVETPNGMRNLGPTPYRDPDDQAGNTWHWAEEAA